MTEFEHKDIHLYKDLYNFLKVIIRNATKYPFEVSRLAIELKLRMDKHYNIKGDSNE